MGEYDLPISGHPPITVPLATDLFICARSGKSYRIAHSDLTAKALGSLVDVDLTGLSNGSFLVYNTTSNKWVVASGVMRTSVYDQNGNGIVDQAEAVPWSGVTGKPTTFTPSAHTHDERYFTETELSLAGGGGIVHWDNLIGVPTLAVGDMRKSVYDTDGDGIVNQAAMVLWSGVSGKPAAFPPAAHNHDDLYFTESELSTSGGGGQVHWNNITNKPAFTTGNMEKGTYDTNNNGIVDAAESVPWSGVTGKPGAFTPSEHHHDDRYYTETELSTSGQAVVHWGNLLNVPSTFTPSAHNHDDRYYTETELQGGTVSVHYNCITNLPASFTPSAHALSHQDGGSDELSVAGLSGVLSDAQNANKLNGRLVANIAPSDGQVLAWNDSTNQFEPADGGSGSGGGGHVIFDETTELTQRENLKFLGQNVTVVDDGDNEDTLVKVSDWPLVKDTLSEPFTIPAGHTLLVGPEFTVDEDLTIDGTLVVVASGGGGGSGTGREVLTANRTYYVRTDGDDNNDGLTDTPGGAFLTIQKAIDAAASIDTSIYNVTIKLANGTYNSGAVVFKNILGPGTVTIEGNNTTPANVVMIGRYYKDTPGTIYIISGQRLVAHAASDAIVATGSATIRIQLIDFGPGYNSHMIGATGGSITASGNYTISAGASWYHIGAINCGMVYTHARTVTLTGSPAFTAFVYSATLSYISAYSMTFIGSATGKRYDVISNSVINVGGGGVNYFPGNAAGTVSTGGQYA